jgi:cell division ATPase FtsA
MTGSPKKKFKIQPKDIIFALDIGTRSIIGIAGTVEGDKFCVIAMEKEEHTQRSMVDGQIEDIEQVAKVAGIVKSRMEETLQIRLKRVCVAAAGRALKTQRSSFEMEFNRPQRLDEEIISRLEAGAIGEAEAAFSDGQASENGRQFYLVGHTAVQYYMDGYPTSSLLDHNARRIQADIIATFLPREVVESLYLTMQKIGLEVVSLTLEPIAAMNVVIPKNLRLLNLALVDIGAGTSDIAICKDGGVVGYTIVTTAGDEITEALMKKYLLDFNTAESVKIQLGSQQSVLFADILGIEQTITQDEMMDSIEESTSTLCREICEQICAVNGSPVSAVFLAGGGSKLSKIQDGIAKYMDMDVKRVAIAGNNFQTYAHSDAYELNDPEYATPLGIAISSGLNLLTESFHVMLNGTRAKLFRNQTMTILDILMMNGFSYQDIIPQTGRKLMIQINGEQAVYHGNPGEPAKLLKNGQEARISDLVETGDRIEFSPAMNGQHARRRLKDLLEKYPGSTSTVNGRKVSLNTYLKNGDSVLIASEIQKETAVSESLKVPSAEMNSEMSLEINLEVSSETVSGISPESALLVNQAPATTATAGTAETPGTVTAVTKATAELGSSIEFLLNHQHIILPQKPDGAPYYLMDMLERSGLDLEHPTGDLVLRVNGAECNFLEDLKPGDTIEIFYKT